MTTRIVGAPAVRQHRDAAVRARTDATGADAASANTAQAVPTPQSTELRRSLQACSRDRSTPAPRRDRAIEDASVPSAGRVQQPQFTVVRLIARASGWPSAVACPRQRRPILRRRHRIDHASRIVVRSRNGTRSRRNWRSTRCRSPTDAILGTVSRPSARSVRRDRSDLGLPSSADRTGGLRPRRQVPASRAAAAAGAACPDASRIGRHVSATLQGVSGRRERGRSVRSADTGRDLRHLVNRPFSGQLECSPGVGQMSRFRPESRWKPSVCQLLNTARNALTDC